MLIAAANWAEVTTIATSLLAVGLLAGFVAALFAAQQVREARRTREAQMAAEFFRRWNEDALVESRRMVGRFKSADELRDAFAAYVATDAPEAYVLYRELDYFEQLAALERQGAFDLELIKLLLGQTLVERWEMWRPAIQEAHGHYFSHYPIGGPILASPLYLPIAFVGLGGWDPGTLVTFARIAQKLTASAIAAPIAKRAANDLTPTG